jgi:membrane-associated phospholipid phosphatase
MQFITDFADQAVLLPLALCVAAWLVFSGCRLAARLWLLSLVAVLAAMVVLKLVVLGCISGTSALTSPSGHTATAVFVFGGIAALALRLRLAATLLAGLALAILFGISRVAVHAHSVLDVVVGGGVGLAVLAAFSWLARRTPLRASPSRLLMVCVPVLLLLHGVHLNMEPHLRLAGRWLGLTICPAADPSAVFLLLPAGSHA